MFPVFLIKGRGLQISEYILKLEEQWKVCCYMHMHRSLEIVQIFYIYMITLKV